MSDYRALRDKLVAELQEDAKYMRDTTTEFGYKAAYWRNEIRQEVIDALNEIFKLEEEA